jgi:hypothetical protein
MWIISKVLHLQGRPALLCAPLVTGGALVMFQMHCRRPVLPFPPFPFQLRILSTRRRGLALSQPRELGPESASSILGRWFHDANAVLRVDLLLADSHRTHYPAQARNGPLCATCRALPRASGSMSAAPVASGFFMFAYGSLALGWTHHPLHSRFIATAVPTACKTPTSIPLGAGAGRAHWCCCRHPQIQ